MEHLFSLEATICPSLELLHSITVFVTYFFMNHFNITRSRTFKIHKWSLLLLLRFSNKIFYAFMGFNACYLSGPSHPFLIKPIIL